MVSGLSIQVASILPWKQQMETWYKLPCTNCQKTNWVNAGNEQDVTTPDPEAIKCWNCNEKFIIEYDDYLDGDENPEDLDDFLDHAYTIQGMEKPE
jgi:hypothetical protein